MYGALYKNFGLIKKPKIPQSNIANVLRPNHQKESVLKKYNICKKKSYKKLQKCIDDNEEKLQMITNNARLYVKSSSYPKIVNFLNSNFQLNSH